MKNIDIIPNTLVPLPIRLEVYKKALEFYKTTKVKHPTYGLTATDGGICLILPSILWDIEYTQNPHSENWNYNDTPNMFPELTDEDMSNIHHTDTTGERIELRIVILERIIKTLERNVEP